MHISCVICSDLFVAADDTFGTQCGHLFHYQCLIQWIERSQSCPQCRNKTTEESIHRIYFNIPNTTENAEDPSILYNKIDSLNLQIRLKDTDIKNITEENVKLKGYNLALREDLKNELESNTRALILNVESMEEKINFIQTLKKEMESLINQLKMRNKELQTETDKKRRIANKLKENDKELNQARSEIYKLKSELKALKESKEHLEQDVKHHEEEVRCLQKKIKKLEEAIVSPTSSKNSALRRLIAESPAPAILKRPRLSNPDGNESTDTVEVVDSSLSLVDSPVSSQPSVPSVKVKTHVFASSSSNAFKFRGMPSSNRFSIFKKPWMGQLEANSLKVPPMEEMYDGHGGHSKLDEFPKPIPKLKTAKRSTQTCVTKLKKKSLSTNSLKIDNFLLSPE